MENTENLCIYKRKFYKTDGANYFYYNLGEISKIVTIKGIKRLFENSQNRIQKVALKEIKKSNKGLNISHHIFLFRNMLFKIKIISILLKTYLTPLLNEL